MEHKEVYGYMRVHEELRKRGVYLNKKTVYRLMKKMGLRSKVRAKKYRHFKDLQSEAAPNLVQRKFDPKRPFEILATDKTEFKLFNKRFFLSAMEDLFDGYILKYACRENRSIGPELKMLEETLDIIPAGSNTILHSDQGWEYKYHSYRELLKKKGIRQSMSRKGNCLDNAPMESFFAVFKTEFLNNQKFDSLVDFFKKLDEYMYYYNNKRIKLKLNGMTPAEYRNQYFQRQKKLGD